MAKTTVAKTKTNRIWHEHNRMPERASMEQRIAWHREHVKHCGCRPIPAGVAAAMKARGAAGSRR